MAESSDDTARWCAWCSAAAAAADTHCATCGAALAQRETTGDLVIPGVTHVDPALEQYAKGPPRIPGANPSHYVAGQAIGAAALGGGPALAALAGLVAVAMTEYRGAERAPSGASRPNGEAGQPSEAIVKMLEQLKEQERAAGLSSEPDPREPQTQPG